MPVSVSSASGSEKVNMKDRHYASCPGYSANGMRNKAFINMIHKLGPYLLTAAHTLKTNVFVVRGSSGIGVANALRMLDLNLKFVMVRKPEEKAHGTPVEVITQSSLDFSEYIFLDDFIQTGSTKRAVQEAIPEATMVGIVLYERLKLPYRRRGLEWSYSDRSAPTLK